MAKKGQKFKKYSLETKMEIVGKYLAGQGSAHSLAKEYGISHHTIESWIYRFRDKGSLESVKRGRPRKENLEEINYKEKYEILKKFQAFIEAQREKK